MEFMNDLAASLQTVSGLVWGWPMVILLIGTHIFLTIRLRFIQRYIGPAIRISLERGKEGQGDVSQFGALTTALAATIGTGNIVGVATAIAAGGPGAVLWMWLTGVFGIATKYSEALLSVKFRVTSPDGAMAGGPMYVLSRGLKMPRMGAVFAALTAIAAFGIGNMVQANSIAGMIKETFGIEAWMTGIVLTILTAVVILGGIKAIAKVCEALVPFMALTYGAGCILLLAMRYDTIPASLLLIISSAFSGQAAVGGFLGAGMARVIRFGIARGLFSNESGLGSAPIVAAAAQTRNPVRQALVSATGTFWDTVVICFITGLTLVNSGCWQMTTCDRTRFSPELQKKYTEEGVFRKGGVVFPNLSAAGKEEFLKLGAWSTVHIVSDEFPADLQEQLAAAKAVSEKTVRVDGLSESLRLALAEAPGWMPESLKGSALTRAAFAEIPSIGPMVLTFGLLTFVFSTILGWSYYGEKAAEYLFGTKIVKPYRLLWVAAVMIGSVVTLQMVWDFADIANALMAIPNLISLLLLSPVLVQETRKYLWEGSIEAVADDQEAPGGLGKDSFPQPTPDITPEIV